MPIKLHFLGAARNVTGSRYLIETSSARVLVDCGLYQEREFRERNWERFVIDPRGIDAVILTHAHLDHCGLLPKLVREGFGGRIHCTGPTAQIVPVVLADAAHIQEEDAKYKARRHRREGRKGPRGLVVPLYTADDVQKTLPRLDEVEYGAAVRVADGVSAVFKNVGHILGSAMVRVQVRDGKDKRDILFSGDVGRQDRPIIRDPEAPPAADYVVMESTYGDRLHEGVDDIRQTLAGIVNVTVKQGGNILIPSFAIERSQEVLYHLAQLRREKKIPRLTVFLDSPMAVKVTEIFRQHPERYDADMRDLMIHGDSPFSFAGLKFSRTRDDSKAINQIRGSSIIIAGSGMCTGGRIKHHLVHNIHRPECAILFVGYQASGTLGRLIVDGRKEVRILGQEHRVRARVAQVHGFSGHADRDELVRWIKGLPAAPKHVFVTHGGANVSAKFARYLAQETGWEASNPEYRDEEEL